LKQKCKEYKENEGRESFYDVAVNIVDDHPLQASIIILATWNSSRFRFFANNPQNLIDLKEAIEKTKPLFEKIKNKEFQTVNLDEIKDNIKEIYSIFSRVKGVEYTGASKVMHLINRNLFIMWDGYIRKEYGLKNNDAEDYFNFLKLMQDKFSNIKWDIPEKSLTKAIDEYNYVIFTLPNL